MPFFYIWMSMWLSVLGVVIPESIKCRSEFRNSRFADMDRGAGCNRSRGVFRRLFPATIIFFLCIFLTAGCGRQASDPVLEPVTEDPASVEASGSPGLEDEGANAGSEDPAGAADLGKSEGSSNPAESAKTEGARENGKSSAGDDLAGAGGALSVGEALDLVTVHVCGAVKKEGVYSLPAGSRVSDAIEAAGGFDPKADKSYLNLALKLEDSWQIRVPTREEAERLREDAAGREGESAISGGGEAIRRIAGDSSGGNPIGGSDTQGESSGSGDSVKININTASVGELTQIPGIGESKAKKIIEYREQNGKFEVIEDIMNVPGIKENSFLKMRDHITVSGTESSR